MNTKTCVGQNLSVDTHKLVMALSDLIVVITLLREMERVDIASRQDATVHKVTNVILRYNLVVVCSVS